jgi:transcriptional regulator with XRE-family HTH domain
MKSMSDTLKRAIRESGKTVYEICKATGLDKGAMSRFLSNTTDLRLESIDKLCTFLGLELTPKSKRKGRKQ